MSNIENTYLRDLAPMINHRKLGRGLYMTDLDSIEYYYVNGVCQIAACIDYKNGIAQQLIATESIDAQIVLANNSNAPFFVILTYLDPDQVPMYYVIAKNELALNSLLSIQKNNKQLSALWMSEDQFSSYLHLLRHKTRTERLNLSTKVVKYELPAIPPSYYL